LDLQVLGVDFGLLGLQVRLALLGLPFRLFQQGLMLFASSVLAAGSRFRRSSWAMKSIAAILP
jgi:hypothetical protein